MRSFRTVIDDDWCADTNNRAQMLAALWSLVRHWDKEGRPKGGGTLQGFQGWANIVGGIVTQAGFGDPFAEPHLELAGDTDAADMSELVKHLLHVNNGEGEWTYDNIIGICHDEGLFVRYVGHDEEERKTIRGSNQRLGGLLKRKEGTWFNHQLEDGTPVRVRFGRRGRQRHRKYTLKVVKEGGGQLEPPKPQEEPPEDEEPF